MVNETISEETLREHQLKWVSEEEMEEFAFPVSHQKMMKAYKEKW
jgi:A/G-specific adenine glycosylase